MRVEYRGLETLFSTNTEGQAIYVLCAANRQFLSQPARESPKLESASTSLDILELFLIVRRSVYKARASDYYRLFSAAVINDEVYDLAMSLQLDIPQSIRLQFVVSSDMPQDIHTSLGLFASPELLNPLSSASKERTFSKLNLLKVHNYRC
jgi:hypothetical protein